MEELDAPLLVGLVNADSSIARSSGHERRRAAAALLKPFLTHCKTSVMIIGAMSVFAAEQIADSSKVLWTVTQVVRLQSPAAVLASMRERSHVLFKLKATHERAIRMEAPVVVGGSLNAQDC